MGWRSPLSTPPTRHVHSAFAIEVLEKAREAGRRDVGTDDFLGRAFPVEDEATAIAGVARTSANRCAKWCTRTPSLPEGLDEGVVLLICLGHPDDAVEQHLGEVLAASAARSSSPGRWTMTWRSCPTSEWTPRPVESSFAIQRHSPPWPSGQPARIAVSGAFRFETSRER